MFINKNKNIMKYIKLFENVEYSYYEVRDIIQTYMR